MKTTGLLLLLVLSGLMVYSQQKIDVVVKQENMSKGQQMAISVIVPESKAEDVESDWKGYVNNRSIGERLGNFTTQVGNIFKSGENKTKRNKLKVEKKDDELYVRSIKQESITNHPMDIYARISQQADGCVLNVFFQYTDSVFFNESNIDKERLQNMKNYIREFGVLAYKDVVDKQIKEAKKEVSNQEGVLKDLNSDTKKQNKSIGQMGVDIRESESDIRNLENSIKFLDDSISLKRQTSISLAKGSDEYSAAKSSLKKLEKEKSKNFSKIKSLEKKITSKKSDIKDAENKISVNDKNVTKQTHVIEEKQKIVDALVQKKEAIQ